LTPGIPEFLSGSTSLEPLVLNPLIFFLFLPFNLGLYGPGALLIREAVIRWHKGWATVIALGGAYAIVEEGLGVQTLFYARAAPVGNLGTYGHAFGVNWVWTTGILMVHIVFSIGLPLLLLGWALPETRGVSLLSRRGIVVALGILIVDVSVLAAFTSRQYGFFYGLPILLASLVAIAGLVFLGYVLPRQLLRTTEGPQRFPRWTLLVSGFVLLLGTFFIEAAHRPAYYFPLVTVFLLLLFYAGLLWFVRSALGPATNVRGGVAFAAGAIGSVMIFGFVSEIRLPIVALADLAACLFLWHLWKRYPDSPSIGKSAQTFSRGS